MRQACSGIDVDSEEQNEHIKKLQTLLTKDEQIDHDNREFESEMLKLLTENPSIIDDDTIKNV